MNEQGKMKVFTLLQREVLEYRNSLLLTPAIIGGVLVLMMFLSVLLANRITVIGDSAMEVLIDEHSGIGADITIQMDEEIAVDDLLIQKHEAPDADDDAWDFGRDWTFEPDQREKLAQRLDEEIDSLNPILNALYALFMVIMSLVSFYYLLSSFHQDRRDRSVLFWKSMPVSEWEEIFTKMAIVCLLLPGIYVAIAIITQLAYASLAMLLVWRMDMSPSQVVLDNINFVSLFGGQLAGWLIWVLWTAPVFAWLLLCSAAAKRSPLLLAIAVPLAMVIVEELFLGGDWIGQAIGNHIPNLAGDGDESESFNSIAPNWSELDYIGLVSGLVVAAGLLAGTHWFRKHRFEL